MRGHLAGVVVSKEERMGAAVLTNTTAGDDPGQLALELAVETIEEWQREPEQWQRGEKDTLRVADLLGRWWGWA